MTEDRAIYELRLAVENLTRDVRHMEKQLSTLGSPWWKRVWFRVQGWPPWWIVAERPARRWWHRWVGGR